LTRPALLDPFIEHQVHLGETDRVLAREAPRSVLFHAGAVILHGPDVSPEAPTRDPRGYRFLLGESRENRAALLFG
jgi:hypothetical protein